MNKKKEHFLQLLCSQDIKNTKLALEIAKGNMSFQMYVEPYQKLANVLNEFQYFEESPEGFIAFYNKAALNLSNYTSHNIEVMPILEQLRFLPHITQLDLSNNYLQNLPLQLYELRHLEKLSLWTNDIYFLEEQIENLENLKDLSLGENKLMDLPPTFTKLRNLTSLSLLDNDLEEFPLEIISLSKLQELDLSENNLQGIPTDIQHLKNLYSLNLSGNDLKQLPPEIANLEALQFLYLLDTLLEKLPPEIKNLKKMRSLNLAGSPISKVEQVKIKSYLPKCKVIFRNE